MRKKRELEEQERLRQEKLRQIESIRWDVSEQSLADYERSLEQCTFLWNDAVFSDAFSPTWQAYMYEGKPGDEVARDFFARPPDGAAGSGVTASLWHSRLEAPVFRRLLPEVGGFCKQRKNGLVRTITEKAALCDFP